MQTNGTGFILSRQVTTLSGAPHLCFWLSTENGPVQVITPAQQAVLFVHRQDADAVRAQFGQSQSGSQGHAPSQRVVVKDVELHTFDHQPVSAVYCASYQVQNDCKTWLVSRNIPSFEGDISLIERFLMERYIQGSMAYIGNSTSANTIEQAKCKASDYHPTFRTVSLDIECSQHGVLYSIGLASPMDTRVIMVGNEESDKRPTDNDLHIQWVADERTLIQALIRWFEQFDPDIIIGWAVVNFDMRLLVKRADYHNIKLTIGRAGKPCYFRQSNQSNMGFITLPGRCVIDGIDGLKSAAHHFASWSLEAVSRELLGLGKEIDNPNDRMDEINRMFYHDKHALARYNIQDCHLVNQIFEKTQLIEYLIERAKLTGLPLDKTGGSVAAFTNLYLPRLHRSGFVAPNLNAGDWEASPGGFVMDSQPGLYNSVLVLDFKSLYPSIIRTFLIDPMGLIEGLRLEAGPLSDQAVPGFKGGQFHRERHHLPKLIETLWAERDKAKQNNNAAFSQAIKIIMNSFYGVLGARGCRFFDSRLASSITMRGHQIMKESRRFIEERGYKVIYGDTDSLFVSLEQAATQGDADIIGQTLVTEANQWWKERIQSEFSLNSCIELEYETHYKKFFMPTIRDSEAGSKKRYAGLVEGDRIVFKGLESVRTDWTELAHEFQSTLYKMVFAGEDPSEYVRSTTQAVAAGKLDDKLIYAKRLRRKLSDYQRNIPPQVRAARLADEKNRQLGKQLQYQNRGQIRYVITLNGPEPLEYLESAIDYQHYIDKQLLPIADAILPHIGMSFTQLNDQQLGLF